MKFDEEMIAVIKKAIIKNIKMYPDTIGAYIIKRYDISKPTVEKYLRELQNDKIIERTRKGRYPGYRLIVQDAVFDYSLSDSLEEDIMFRNDIFPLIKDMPENIIDALTYGFTEMVNNVIDHSEATRLHVHFRRDAIDVRLYIRDDGVGIFYKIQKDLGLSDPKQSILELYKGKFTSDPVHHSGEGIFFTSRICDGFAIFSGNILFSGHKDNDLLKEIKERNLNGTLVGFMMKCDSAVKVADVFNEYSDPDENPGFYRTKIPVKLMEYEGEKLLSRSQAKRLINRFDRFIEVELDFEGVTEIGQSFADQIFRVFHAEHPDVHLVPTHCSVEVKKMIAHVSVNFCQDVYNTDILLPK